MKRKSKVIIGALALLAGAGLAAPSGALAVSAEGEEAPISAPASEESPASVEISSAPEESLSETAAESSEGKKGYLEDKDGDGIPDAVNDYYNEHIRDQYMFGITLGSLIGFAVSAFGWLFTYIKYTKMGKDIHEAMGLTSANAKETAENFAKMVRSSESLEASMNQAMESMTDYGEQVKAEARAYKESLESKSEEMRAEYEAKAKEMAEKIGEAEQAIEEYRAEAEKIKAKYAEMEANDKLIAKAVNELSHTEEYVRNGVADSVGSITKGVRDDG